MTLSTSSSMRDYTTYLADEIAKTKADNDWLREEIEAARQENEALSSRIARASSVDYMDSIRGDSQQMPARDLSAEFDNNYNLYNHNNNNEDSSAGSSVEGEMLSAREARALNDLVCDNLDDDEKENDQQHQPPPPTDNNNNNNNGSNGIGLSSRELAELQRQQDDQFSPSPDRVVVEDNKAKKNNNNNNATAHSASTINALVRGVLTREGLTAVCYLDGTNVALPLLGKHITQERLRLEELVRTDQRYADVVIPDGPAQHEMPTVSTSSSELTAYNLSAMNIYKQFFSQVNAAVNPARRGA
eukprot:PhM_4_TR10211/c2_g1_i1/m.92944